MTTNRARGAEGGNDSRPDTPAETMILASLRQQLATYKPVIAQMRDKIPPRIATRLDDLIAEIDKDAV